MTGTQIQPAGQAHPNATAPALSLMEFQRRNLEILAANGEPAPELDEAGWRWMQEQVPKDLASARAEQRAMDVKLSWAEVTRFNVDTFAYLAGETDTHPLVHGAPATVTAAELCGRHLGMTMRSQTYANAKKRTPPHHDLQVYTVDNIHHLKSGAVLLNGSWPYLHADTVLTIVSATAAGAQAA